MVGRRNRSLGVIQLGDSGICKVVVRGDQVEIVQRIVFVEAGWW